MCHSFISMYLMSYFLLRCYYAVAISGNSPGLIPGHCAAVGFFFFLLLLINCWCAVSNLTIIHGSWISCSCQLSSALSMFWWMEILQAVACICVFKKKKKKVFPQSFLRVFIQLPRSTLISLKRVSGCQQLVGVDKWTPWFSLAV